MLGIFWAAGCVAVLVWTLAKLQPMVQADQLAYEVTLLHLVAIVAFNFPLGLIALVVGALPRALIDITASTLGTSSYVVETVLVWLVACAAGYVQWLKLVPAFIRRMRSAKRLTRAGPTE
jgi:hypothetical protein